MVIEIVDLPMKNRYFSIGMLVYQRVILRSEKRDDSTMMIGDLTSPRNRSWT
jgi:hypothetical protein